MRKKDNNLVVMEYIPLLDLPTYVLDEKGNRKELDIKRADGTFTMESSRKLPNHFDNKVLYYLLTQITRGGKIVTHEARTTRYAIATVIYKGRVSNSGVFDRILQALERYKYTIFSFEGIFYGDVYKTRRYFSYVDDVIFDEETKELYVKFNQQYMTLIKESGLIKYINFDIYNSFTLATSSRLYQILCKVLEYNSSWSIGLQNLAEKMTLQKRSGAKGYYASDVLAKIKPGINEISQKSPLNISFNYNKKNDAITFNRIKKKKETINILPAKKTALSTTNVKISSDEDKRLKYLNLFKSLSDEDQKSILSAIEINKDIYGVLSDKDEKIYAYMSGNKKWKMKIDSISE